MKNSLRLSHVWLVLLLLAGALALSACGGAPLPPLFVASGSDAAQPAAPAAFAPLSQPVASAAEIPAPAAGEAITATAAIPAEQPAAPAASAAITETNELTATAAMTVAVRAADVVTVTAPISAPVAAAPAEVAVVVVESSPTPTAMRSAPTATRVLPTATRIAPTATRAAPTATRAPARPTATRAAPTATRAPARPTATPTPEWPRTLVITAEDIEEGASSVPGLQITGLDVTFGNNSMTMAFDSLRYSFVSMRNVTVVGRFVVNNCDVDFVTDSISPRNLATSAIPGFINQSLDQQLGAWCVEGLAVQPEQLVATVRPR